MIKNFDELVQAIIDCTRRLPEGTHEDIAAWANADEEVLLLRRLHSVWMEAQDNPPEGVIGVGIITYAEHKLVEAQQDA